LGCKDEVAGDAAVVDRLASLEQRADILALGGIGAGAGGGFEIGRELCPPGIARIIGRRLQDLRELAQLEEFP
jgi:hypothetical protein